MGKTMLTIKLDPEQASVDAVRKRFDLKPGEIDDRFGVVDVDPSKHVYAVLVDEHAASSIADRDPGVSGPFADAKIEPFGPPQA